jgi:tetratricopeptide (TPR) repeat protein
MAAPFSNTPRTKFLILVATLFIFVSMGACRWSEKTISNTNGSTSSTATDPEQAKRQARSLIEEGKELYKNDQDEQAADSFKRAINQDPDNAEAHLRLGMAHAALDKKTEAEDEYKKAVELFKKRVQADPRDGDAFFYLGEAHSFLHQDEDAARAYRQATKLKPEDEEAFYQLGLAETKLAHYPEATAAFQKALDLDPNDYRASDAIENAKEGTQRIKEGKKHAEEMLKKQQENANANMNSNSSVKPSPKRTPGKPW